MVQFLNGIEELVSSYDGVIADLWGVVHDGARVFDGAVECLIKLAGHGVRVAFVSNTSRSEANLKALLKGLGIEDSLFEVVSTSGQLVKEFFEVSVNSKFDGRCRYLLLGAPLNTEWLDQRGLVAVTAVDQADVLVA